ncbi:RluA family pseudouridine synthase [Ruminococcus gauvreauii]|uniref:Pseudouridine synthase n=1 Tax=Ruminococcus gauvreauii TaxID=438033 RepID=A0ABY5VG08_9FIRM|nr:RluA family pseudouridine synthase [Ruminococcus gauvreauii]UWP59173.1 RluA family pseudouridine synthase [Ruminococcus gauvreauii]
MEKKLRGRVSEEGLLYDFLSGNLGLTKREISQAKFRTDGVCVNGRRARVTAMLQAGDVVEVKLEEAETQSGHLVPYAGKPDILYEDEDILLVNKPAGVVVHPSHGHYSDSLANMLVQYFMEKGEQVKIRSVGRLDKETSGIVVFAKNQAAAGRLARQRELGQFKKEYFALVHGVPEQRTGSIRTGIAGVPGSLMKMMVTETGKHAVTHYAVQETFGGFSAVRVLLETGRTHQIRVHMASIGHALLGDKIYGAECGGIERAALHAYRVKLMQPFSGEEIRIKAEMPEDMRKKMNQNVAK